MALYFAKSGNSREGIINPAGTFFVLFFASFAFLSNSRKFAGGFFKNKLAGIRVFFYDGGNYE